MKLLRVISTFERPDSLLRVLRIYSKLNQHFPTYILDSSSVMASPEVRELCALEDWSYIHMQGLGLCEKINTFFSTTGINFSSYDYIQFATDQDLFFYSDGIINDAQNQGFDILLTPQLAWQYLEAPVSSTDQPAIFLRDQTSRVPAQDPHPYSLEAWNNSMRILRCKYPNTNLFWSLVKTRVAKIRNNLMVSLSTLLPNEDKKAIELYVNVFNSYCTTTFDPSSLVLRDADPRDSLRSTNSDEKYARKSFYSSFCAIKDNSILYKETLKVMREALDALTDDAKYTSLVAPRSFEEIDSLLHLNVASYGTALSYDFNQRAYLYDYVSHDRGGCTRNHLLLGSPQIYSHLRLTPLVIERNFDHSEFVVHDPSSPLADQNVASIIKNIPHYYWTKTVENNQRDFKRMPISGSLNSTFCLALFFRGKDDIFMPNMLSSSMRKLYGSRVEIVFLTDASTPCPEDVDQIHRFDFDTESLMHSRIKAYAQYTPQKPTFYLDCDMLPAGDINQALLDQMKGSYVLCKRSYGLNATFNTGFKGIDYSRYSGKTIGEVYPILASFSYAEDNKFWQQCLEYFSRLDSVFYEWYGDQEVIRDVAASGVFTNIKYIDERTASRLPEDSSDSQCLFWHFKGNRKAEMKKRYEYIMATSRA